jgi:hypothetical protein
MVKITDQYPELESILSSLQTTRQEEVNEFYSRIWHTTDTNTLMLIISMALKAGDK